MAATLSKASGVVACDWLAISDNTATGGATFYAGRNSTQGANVTGWTFTDAPGPTTVTVRDAGTPTVTLRSATVAVTMA